MSASGVRAASPPFAQQCIELVESFEIEQRNSVEAEALWRAAQLHYFKCFGVSEGRRQLDPVKVFGKSNGLLEAHRKFLVIRNKHLAHDEGTHTMSHVAAIIAPISTTPKVQRVLVAAMDTVTLTTENLATMKGLATRALVWTEAEFEAVTAGIMATLDLESHERLLSTRSGRMRFIGKNRAS